MIVFEKRSERSEKSDYNKDILETGCLFKWEKRLQKVLPTTPPRAAGRGRCSVFVYKTKKFMALPSALTMIALE